MIALCSSRWLASGHYVMIPNEVIAFY